MERTRAVAKIDRVLSRRWHRSILNKPVFSVAVASGKGGTGKSVCCASLAAYFAGRQQRVTLFDADLGVGNAHILQGVSPAFTAAHVVNGKVELHDIGITAATGVKILPAGSGVGELATLSTQQLEKVARGFTEVEKNSDVILIDSAAGIADQTIRFLAAADLTILVTTPDLTAMTDAYALIKVLHRRNAGARVFLIVNKTDSKEEGVIVARKIQGVAKRFLEIEVDYLGSLPEDRRVGQSIAEKKPIILGHPDSEIAARLCRMGKQLANLQRLGKRDGQFGSRLLHSLS